MTHHATSVSAILCALVTLLSGSALAEEVVIDFQALTHAGAGPAFVRSWQEEGFTLTSNIDPVLQDISFAAWGTGSPDFPGSTSLFAVFPSVISLKRTDGSVFDAKGLSLAPLFAGFAVPTTVMFMGQLAAGGFVSQAVTLSASMSLQAFEFNPTFSDLLALRWRQSDLAPHQFDDIRLAVAAVPEPATALCILCGLLVLAALRSRSLWTSRAAPRPGR